MPTLRLLPPAAFLLFTACSSLQYDLTGLPLAISAMPAPPGTGGERFELRDSLVLWCYGLFGESQPDVLTLLADECAGCVAVADFRVEASASLHAWLLTHLTLGLVRYKVVTIRGQKIRARS